MSSKNNSNIIGLLEFLADSIEQGKKVPITGKVIVDKNEVLEIIDEIMNFLPDEFKKAQWVMNEKDRILTEAKKEHEDMKIRTEQMIQQQVDTHDIVKEAEVKAQEIISRAQREAKEIRLGSRDYADKVLSDLENEMNEVSKQMINTIKIDVESITSKLYDDINKTSKSIRSNVKELRDMK